MSNHLYSIRCLTNLHVGSGETIGMVDKMIQRDPITSRPVIHGPSLKGALREYFKKYNDSIVREVFGAESSSDTKSATAGAFRFFSAHIISMPMRSNKRPYYNVSCRQAIEELLEMADNLGITLTEKDKLDKYAKLEPGDKAMVFEASADGDKLEDIEICASTFADIEKVKKIIGNHPALIRDDIFTEFCRNELPVIARNHLNDGKSTNLWYEEIVPRESRFIFSLIGDDKNESQFEKTIEAHPIQIGGNATVGYGFAAITRLAKGADHEKTD